jgi:integrase
MASLQLRGDSIRILWRLGGSRDGARQSCTFSGEPATEREEFAKAAKTLVEARGHNITREQCYEAILGKPEPFLPSMLTFKQWTIEWIRLMREGGQHSGPTLTKYERALRLRVVPRLGHLRLDHITREHVTDWVKWMTAQHVTVGSRSRRDTSARLAPRTIRDIYWVLASCLSAAVPKLIPANPAARLPGESANFAGLPVPERFDGMFLSKDEIFWILEQCSEPLLDMVVLALRTGMRVGELMALQVRHVTFSRTGGATILVRATAKQDGTVGAPKSKAGIRDITVGEESRVVLDRLVSRKRASDLVLPGPSGGMWEPTVLRRSHWYRAVAQAQRCPEHLPDGVPGRVAPLGLNAVVSSCGCPGVLQRRPRFHDLRHTHASVLIDEKWHARKIQGRLGHSSYQTTMAIYGHLMDLGDENEVGGIDGWFSR